MIENKQGGRIMNMTILWSHTGVREEDLGESVENAYIDFEISGIQGVFRAARGCGVNIEKVLQHVEANSDFLAHVCSVGLQKISDESSTHENWGGGWSWEETSHPKQTSDYCFSKSVSWYTCPFGQRVPGVKSMDAVHGQKISSEGVKILFSHNSNWQPVDVFYFFPHLK
jgi:hypothetical protein